MKIGIIGQGFVGSAIREGLKNFYDICTYDLDHKKCDSTHQEVCRESDIIFVCVPTPMKKTGECDTRIIEDAINRVTAACNSDPERNYPILVVKSTVPPGTCAKLSNSSICPLVFSPEFLTEANSFEDFRKQSRLIIGGNSKINCKFAKKVKQMFRKPFPDIPIIITKWETAEMVKYFTNCFLSTKVIFANQMYEICEKANIDYDKVCEYALYDNRIGKSHLAVPGPDGDFGFGGHCFPKDLGAMIYFSKQLSIIPDLLHAVQDENNHYRKNKDWEKMIGRAVTDEE